MMPSMRLVMRPSSEEAARDLIQLQLKNDRKATGLPLFVSLIVAALDFLISRVCRHIFAHKDEVIVIRLLFQQRVWTLKKALL